MNHLHDLHFKRLQHPVTTSPLLNDEAIRHTIQNFSRLLSRPFPNHAKRGGRTASNRRCYPSASLPKRTIYYDLAESLMDHSTNPLSSDLYKVRFKHSTKPWPDGRFQNYKEKLEQPDGNLTDITCRRTIPTIPKRRKLVETVEKEQSLITTIPSSTPVDPGLQQLKKKMANKQKDFYTDLYGSQRALQFPAAYHIKKKGSADPSTTWPTSTTVVDQNQEA